MFKFEHTQYFYGFAFLAFLVILTWFYYYSRSIKIKKLGDVKLVKQLIPYYSRRKRNIKFIFLFFALSSLILALCNLQTGSRLTEVKREGADIVVCLDVSNSMLAQDLQPNRLERAKYALEKMINGLEGDRLGLVIFAGEAYVQLPITSDYNAAKMFLSSISTKMVPVQGTNMEAAIQRATESFGKDLGKNKAIILITDGENHESEALSAAENAASKGIMINTIGIGSASGVPIPLIENGVMKGFRKNKQGETIVTKLNSEILKQIAAKGKGVYVEATKHDLGIKAILNKIDELEKFDTKMFTDYEDQFQWFLGLSLILLVFECAMSERASEWFKKLKLFEDAPVK